MSTSTSASQLKHLRVSDLRGVAQLATQATIGVTSVAEGVHQSVWDSLGVPGGAAPGRARGVTGLVYSSVRGVARLVGWGVDAALARLQPVVAPAEETALDDPRREAVLAVLNGVIGDRLVAAGNPLATPMSLRYRSRAIDWQALPPMPEATGRVLLLIHGLCKNDLQWRAVHDGTEVDHGQTLASALGYTPLYLRYNSGLPTARNGRELSALMERLVTHWPTQVDELSVVAHSMGGLVVRSACHVAKQDASRWLGRLKSIVFLGTPHQGAPLERAGSWVDTILASTPYTAPLAALGRVRSVGITDLRHGSVLEDCRPEDDHLRREAARCGVVPLPAGVACFTVAATTAASRSRLADRLIGDGLVPLHSALGRNDDPRRDLGFAAASQWIAHRTNHLQLLSNPAVTRRMVRWLTPEGS